MILFKTIIPLRDKIEQLKIAGKSIGFVPTMGALHEGHISLIRQSKAITDITICSIFINPRQFNDAGDFEKYPRTFEQDIFLLEKNGTDIIFLPDVNEVYPTGQKEISHYNLGYLEEILEGYYRPGHFQGVCKAVHRLLKITEPDILFLGQKDYQQCMVIKKMMLDNNINTELFICPTLRETNGLAMSSRNTRLSSAGKEKAAALYKALCFIYENINQKSKEELKEKAVNMIKEAGFEKVDYVEICNALTLNPIINEGTKKQFVVVAAAFIEGVRIIDNRLKN